MLLTPTQASALWLTLAFGGPPLSSASKFQSAQKVEGFCFKSPDDLLKVTQMVAEPGFKASKSNLNLRGF